MGTGWERRLVGIAEPEIQMPQYGRGHHGKIEIIQIGRKIALHGFSLPVRVEKPFRFGNGALSHNFTIFSA